MPAVQKRIRDLERALKRKSPDDPSLEALRVKLESLREEKKQNEQQEKERKFSTKYHQVKFFERKKLTRQIHKIINKLNDTTKSSTIEKLTAEKAKLEEDLAYVLYYPKDMKYISLLVQNEENPAKTQALRQKARERALQQYADAKETDDRVAHAIDVELNPTHHKAQKKSRVKPDTDANANSEEASNSESDSGDDESSESSGSSSDSEESGDESSNTSVAKTPVKASQNKKTTKAPAPTAVVAPAYEPDPFFLEEVTNDNNMPLPSSYETKQSRAAHQPRFQRQPNLKGMHKQDVRMMQWKQKVKAKSRPGYVAPVVEKRVHKPEPSAKQDKFAPRAPKRKFDHDAAPIKKAWEEGRGVSAASSSDLIRQKQTGIVKIGQGTGSKKIKFDA